mgnify:CR=1 FL=1
MNFSSSGLTVTGADEGVGFGAGAGCDGAEETVLSAGGLEETDDTGSAELTAELVLSTTDDTLGCDEMVLLAKVLFGVFLQPDTSIAAQRTKAAALILLLIFFAPFKRINISLSVYDS